MINASRNDYSNSNSSLKTPLNGTFNENKENLIYSYSTKNKDNSGPVKIQSLSTTKKKLSSKKIISSRNEIPLLKLPAIDDSKNSLKLGDPNSTNNLLRTLDVTKDKKSIKELFGYTSRDHSPENKGEMSTKSHRNIPLTFKRTHTMGFKKVIQENNDLSEKDNKDKDTSDKNKIYFKKETMNNYETPKGLLSPPNAKTIKNFFKSKTKLPFSLNTKNKKEINQRNLNENQEKINHPLLAEYPDYPKAMHSNSTKEWIRNYGVNSYRGKFRNYNEDRVVILLNIGKPNGYQDYWPNQLSIFGLFDGHNGKRCANFLRDNLHKYLINSKYFPKQIELAIEDSFKKLDDDFINKYAIDTKGKLVDNSGSCAIVAIVADRYCYIANVGDSRAILSNKRGKEVLQLSNDHKPIKKKEKARILQNGGIVYKASDLGIYRVIPGNLSVCRAFGDAQYKIKKFGGKENVIISTPEIEKFSFDISKNDFLILGCDGIFDKSDNFDIVNNIWDTLYNKETLRHNVHSQAGAAADTAIKFAMQNNSTDNVTAIFIGFEGFEDEYNKVTHRKRRKDTSPEKKGEKILKQLMKLGTTSTKISDKKNEDEEEEEIQKRHNKKLTKRITNDKGEVEYIEYPEDESEYDEGGDYVYEKAI